MLEILVADADIPGRSTGGTANAPRERAMIEQIDPTTTEAAALAAQQEQKRQAAQPASDGVLPVAGPADGIPDLVASGVGDVVGVAIGIAAEGAGAMLSTAGAVVSMAGEATATVIGGIFEGL
jgi:hypothetical protein